MVDFVDTLGYLTHIGEFGPFQTEHGEVPQEDVGIVVQGANDDLFDGMGALRDGSYLLPPINRFKIVAKVLEKAHFGYTLGAFSPFTYRGYSAKTEVVEEHRRLGLGTELLRQKMRLFEHLDAVEVYSMIGSPEGRKLVESQGFEYDEELTAWAVDEFYTWENPAHHF